MIELNRKPLQIWECKIGECPDSSLPNAADCPMREAVTEAYKRISGHEPQFLFSGWNAELTERERAAHENRIPNDPTPHALTREEVEEALKETAYKYFGDYEMSKGQRDAVFILEQAAQEWITQRHALEQQAQEIERLKEKWQGRRSNLIDYYEEQLTLVKAELTASEQELMKVRAEKDEQWVKLCAAERKAVRLRDALTMTLNELHGIASANVNEWDTPTDAEFKAWAQNRARHTHEQARGALKGA